MIYHLFTVEKSDNQRINKKEYFDMVLKITQVKGASGLNAVSLQSRAIKAVLQNLARACQVLNTGVVLIVSTIIQRTDLARGKYVITCHQPFGLYG